MGSGSAVPSLSLLFDLYVSTFHAMPLHLSLCLCPFPGSLSVPLSRLLSYSGSQSLPPGVCPSSLRRRLSFPVSPSQAAASSPPGRGSISAEKPSLEHTLGSSAAPAIATVPLLPGPLSCLSKDWDFFSLHSLVSLPTCHPSMTSRRVLTRDAHFPPYRGQAHPGAKRPDALAREHPPHFPECSEHQGA